MDLGEGFLHEGIIVSSDYDNALIGILMHEKFKKTPP